MNKIRSILISDRKLILLFSLGWILTICISWIQPVTAQQPPNNPSLRVVTKPLEPLVIFQGDQPAGFSVDLWEEVARRINHPYQWQRVETVTQQLAAIQQGTADVAIAGISMTPEREAVVDFSYPYLDAGLQIMTRAARTQSIFAVVGRIFTIDLLKLFATLLLFLLILAHLVWLYGRWQKNDRYTGSYFHGIGEALWWTAMTLVATSYGEEDPKDGFRRFIAVVWMFIGLVLISNFIAAITTQNTLEGLRSNLSGVNDLPGKQIATVEGSTAAKYLSTQGLTYTSVTGIEQAYPLLEAGKVDVIVYDSPVLQHYASNQGRGKVQLADSIFKPEVYGIALPQNSPYREEINRALLEIKLDGTYNKLYDKWFDAAELEE